MTRIVLALVAALVSTVPAGAMTREQRSELRRLLTEQIHACRVNSSVGTDDGPIFIRYHARSLPDIPATLWGPDYKGPLFNTRKFLSKTPDYSADIFVSIRLKPDGWLADEPKIMLFKRGEVPAIEEVEADTHSTESWVDAIRRCAPYRIPASFADSYAEWKKTTCVHLHEGLSEVRRHPCVPELYGQPR